MKAVIYERYGGPEVLQLKEIPMPVPKDHEVLVEVCATTVTAGDTRMRSFTVPKGQWLFARLYLGLLKPRRQVLGMELSGKVTAVGKQVTRFNVGDSVYASTMQAGFGAYAEYKCLPENAVMAHKPVNLSYAEAAALPIGGVTALRFLRKGNIHPGQRVLIYGASGSVGTYAVQLAKQLGAEVTGVCSTASQELVRSLGADNVIDYTRDDLARESPAYDLIFDAVGKMQRNVVRSWLKKNGAFVSVSGNPGKAAADDLLFLSQLAVTGKLKAVIWQEFDLKDIVEAHRLVDSGRKKGNVVVNVRSFDSI